MAHETQLGDVEDAQSHEKRRVWTALASALLVLSTFFLVYVTLRYLRFRSRVRTQSTTTSLPWRRAEVVPQVEGPTQATVPLHEVTVHRIDGTEAAQNQQHCMLLQLPAEIRTQIYSYLLPDTAPTSTSRAFRQTCRQINDEVEYEVRKAFISKMTRLQQLYSDYYFYCNLACSTKTYNVEIALRLPEHYYSPVLPPPFSQTTTVIDAIALSLIELLPKSTRFITLTIQPHPHGTISTFERYFDNAWTALDDCFKRAIRDAKEGKTDLQTLSIFSRDPIALVPEVGCFGFTSKLRSIIVPGVRFTYDRNFRFRMRVVLDPQQGYLLLKMRMLEYLKRRVKLYIAWKR
jgi:hypothetical protein